MTQQGDIYLHGPLGMADGGFLWICSGYAVHNNRVVLVHHNRFDRWVPPGGHMEPGETPAATAAREFLEETGHEAAVISAGPEIHPADGNARAEPLPFYMDVEVEGFRKPALVFFYFMRLMEPSAFEFDGFQRSELHGIGSFTEAELDDLPTFEQVRSLSRYALAHHPAPTSP